MGSAWVRQRIIGIRSDVGFSRRRPTRPVRWFRNSFENDQGELFADESSTTQPAVSSRTARYAAGLPRLWNGHRGAVRRRRLSARTDTVNSLNHSAEKGITARGGYSTVREDLLAWVDESGSNSTLDPGT